VILGVLYGLGSSLAIAAFFVRLPAAALAVMAAACVGLFRAFKRSGWL
jgi:uncharacterized membrane protein